MNASFSGVSIYATARIKADEHKWYESERARVDRGNAAIQDWIEKYWYLFARSCWFEHIRGTRLYLEFHISQFAVLQELARRFPEICKSITEMLEAGKENLDIINWAIDSQVPMDPVIEFLESVDVNCCRMSCNLVEGEIVGQRTSTHATCA
jgi:hypothetical protein